MPHDIVDKFSTHLKNVLTRALCFVVEINEKAIEPEHLLWSLGTQKGCIGAEILKKVGIKAVDLKRLIEGKPFVQPSSNPSNPTLHLSDNAKRAVEKAILTASMYGHRYVGTEHLLSGILQIDTEATRTFFSELNTDLKELKSQLAVVLKSTSKFPDVARSINSEPTILTQTQTRQKEKIKEEEKKISALEYFSVELTSTEVQKTIDPVIGREREIERVMEILCRRTKNNPLLLGEAGVGKTAIIEGLAKQVTQGLVPPLLQHKRIFALDMALLIAGTMYRGEFEGRLRQIVDEVKQDPEVILFIDEIQTIVGAGAASGSMDAANILKPSLARGEIRCIGATTPAEFKKYIESDAALERRFQTVFIEEPSQEKTIEILEGIAPYYERYHHVRITHEAIQSAVALSSRYLQDRQLPDKAIDLIDEAAAAMRVHELNPGPMQKERELYEALEILREQKRQAVVEEHFDEAMRLKEEEEAIKAGVEALRVEEHDSPLPVMTEEEVARVVSRATGVPLEDLTSTDKSRLLQLEEQLRCRVLGQDPVIETVAGALRRAKTGVAHPNRPLASFLFLGPSGVGKTELAKAIAETLFYSKQHFTRLDMSEYSEAFTMSKLIGSPAGYVGYKETAHLTDRVKQRPYSVVLFDEIEKAHQDVQNLLLQILEEGELTDATGRRVNFRNTLIVMTSNAGLERFERADVGFATGATDQTLNFNPDVRNELNERFRPELLNRLDHICLFQPLNEATLDAIVKKQFDELTARLKEQGLTVTIHDNVVSHIRALAEPKYGARNIRILIQKEIEHKIAERLSKKNRPSSISVKLIGKQLRVTTTRSRA